MLRKSLSTNRVVKTRAMQCLQATSTNNVGIGTSVIIPSTHTKSQTLTSCNLSHYQQQQQKHCHFTTSSSPTAMISSSQHYLRTTQQQPFSIVGSRFKSTSPFPSLKPQNGQNGNQTRASSPSASSSGNAGHRNTNHTNPSTGSKGSPWKHFNIPKRNDGTNANSNRSKNNQKRHGGNSTDGNHRQGNNHHNNNMKRSKQKGQPQQQKQRNPNHPKGKGGTINGNGTNNTKHELRPIDKLRDSFMQSLQSDRERRQNNNNNNINNNSGTTSFTSPSTLPFRKNEKSNTESRLDQLLRMSRQKARTNHERNNNSNNNNPNYNNNSNGNYTPTKSGAKLFRERRKMQQQQQQQQQQKNNQQNQRHHQIRHGQYQTNKTTNALQQELLRSNATALNHELNHNQSSASASALSEDEKIIILPRKDLTLVELSSLLRVPKDKIIKVLKSLGENRISSFLQKTSSNASDDVEEGKIDIDMVELIALELGLDPQRANRTSCQLNDAERRILRMGDDEEDDNHDKDNGMLPSSSMEDFPTRPPVVCIMGHVDHGKTTLMDCLRQRALDASGGSSGKKKAKKKKGKKKKKGDKDANGIQKVAGTEAGGITQTVSAFQVALPTALDGSVENGNSSSSETKSVDKVTFLDTPGHAAFKAMRQSGSNGADVIVLVIAADDGVSPQTIEIIDMYKSIATSQPGSISLVVAMTKVDKPGIDVDESLMMIENQLMEHDIFSENLSNASETEFGGVQVFPVSGLSGEGIDDLIEGLVLQSEIMDLRADTEARAEGLVIDAKVCSALDTHSLS